MTKKIIITLASIVFIFFLYYRYGRGAFIHVANNYKIYSNTGQSIPAKVLVLNHDNLKKSNVLNNDDYFIVFDDSLYFDSPERGLGGPEILYVYPNGKQMFYPCQIRESFVRINSELYYQRDVREYSKDIVNSNALFADTPIRYAHFQGNKVVFNTYGPLKQFGDSIILEIGK